MLTREDTVRIDKYKYSTTASQLRLSLWAQGTVSQTVHPTRRGAVNVAGLSSLSKEARSLIHSCSMQCTITRQPHNAPSAHASVLGGPMHLAAACLHRPPSESSLCTGRLCYRQQMRHTISRCQSTIDCRAQHAAA